ncbi:phosphatidylinositol 4-kinase gamma 5-like [Iris pallida]|uniref:1-phosphatidylinositol 4-kinase n=1 Tax=Iris pallida TaxID=29817 RepID=A0AAX6GYA9_IRIPA|nr:phosphatidylinositol 4-kinase gamma 5-like [Iris pallida]
MIFTSLHLPLSTTASALVFGVHSREEREKRTLSTLLSPCCMSPNLPSPVQTQMAVTVLNNTLRSEFHGSNEYHGTNKFEGKPVGRRRVFVQTETGCVLGIELDRGDNAHTVKRRLQVALNVSTEESSLTFGDRVLKNDLSTIRNDSPLLLTRNQFHRSSSTPCLSPTAKDIQQRDQSGPIEVLGCSSHCSRTKQLVKDVVKAMKSGLDPIPVHSGLGGAYYFRNSRGESVAIVKPTDEEPFAPNNPKGFVGKAIGQPGLKRSVRVGETGFREVAAYLLDHDRFANVPPTVLSRSLTPYFMLMKGSIVAITRLTLGSRGLSARLLHSSSLWHMILMLVIMVPQASPSLLFTGLGYLTLGSLIQIDMLETCS